MRLRMAIRFSEQEYRPKAKIYPAKKLQEKYEGCADQSILYIGKAEGKRGLRQRLKQYMDYGRGNGNIHAGGRAVWQISDCGLLLLAYEAYENAGERERQLLQEYREKTAPITGQLAGLREESKK